MHGQAVGGGCLEAPKPIFRPTILNDIRTQGLNVTFKFVCKTGDDVHQADGLGTFANLPIGRCWVVAEGLTALEVLLRGQAIRDAAMARLACTCSCTAPSAASRAMSFELRQQDVDVVTERDHKKQFERRRVDMAWLAKIGVDLLNRCRSRSPPGGARTSTNTLIGPTRTSSLEE